MRVRDALVPAAALAAWALTAHAVRNLGLLRRPVPGPPVTDRVSVLVPARDEQERIGACVRAVLAQRGVDDLEVLVLDDDSSDGTAAVVAGITDGRLRLLTSSAPVPPGWTGKAWACARLAEEADGGVLVFVDADVTLEPEALVATVGLLRGTGLDLVSPYPRQLADGLLPRLVQPLLQWSWLTFVPLRLAETGGRPSLAVADGQLLACDTGAYAAVGGHGAVRGAVLEDVALARAFVRAGRRAVVVDGTHLATCRMYDGDRELIEGYAKSLWAAFGSAPGAAAVVAALTTVYVLPPVAALVGRGPTRWWGLLGWAGGVAGRVVVARRTGSRVVPDTVAHPASVVAFGALVAVSWRRRRAGTLTWRGRPMP